jgi:predicted nuclease of predicted toxin-antitoxin system
VHTLELAEGNASTDQALIEFADANGYVLVSKDSDFVDTHLLVKRPQKLLHLTIGNASNFLLLGVFERNHEVIARGFEAHDFVELSLDAVTLHERS